MFESLHTGRESEGHLSWYAAYCVYHSSTILVYIVFLCVVRHTKSTGSLLSLHSWNVHDSVQEPDMFDFHRLLHLLRPGSSSL